jgi:hypothetical protein
MRVSGQDELLDPVRCVILDQVGDLAMAADHGGSRPTSQQPDAGPQVRVDLQVAGITAVPEILQQRLLPPLAHRLADRERLLRGRDLIGAGELDQPRRLGPGLPRVIPGDDVDPHPEAQLPALLRSEPAHPADLLPDLRGRLAEGQVHIRLPGRHLRRGRR